MHKFHIVPWLEVDIIMSNFIRFWNCTALITGWNEKENLQHTTFISVRIEIKITLRTQPKMQST